MNLNNKYLAIGLSVAAAGLVFYQIFINKACEAKPSVRPQASGVEETRQAPPPAPAQRSAAAPQSQSPAQTGAAAANSANSADNGLTIDYNSPMLLDRVHSQMAQKYPRKELLPQVGTGVFSRGIEPKGEREAPRENVGKEVKFELNAIIMDTRRKLAIINGVIVKEGDMVAGAKINVIAKSKVVLKINNQTVILSTNSRIKTVRLLGGNGEVNR